MSVHICVRSNAAEDTAESTPPFSSAAITPAIERSPKGSPRVSGRLPKTPAESGERRASHVRRWSPVAEHPTNARAQPRHNNARVFFHAISTRIQSPAYQDPQPRHQKTSRTAPPPQIARNCHGTGVNSAPSRKKPGGKNRVSPVLWRKGCVSRAE